MGLEFYKYQGTGNDFIVIDNRNLNFDKNDTFLIQKLCDRNIGIGADGLILLENHETLDFEMVYFNADSSESGFCGNGSRCVTHFAKFLGIIQDNASFQAIDGIHYSKIINGFVSVKMNDIDSSKVIFFNDKYNATFVDTGSPHLILNRNDIDNFNILDESYSIKKYFTNFKDGININYYSIINGGIRLRTFERGVESETQSCGTGAVALAYYLKINSLNENKEVTISMKGGDLNVKMEKSSNIYKNVWLSGDVDQVYYGKYNLSVIK